MEKEDKFIEAVGGREKKGDRSKEAKGRDWEGML